MKKVIAIVLSLLYLSFTSCALTGAHPDILSYETVLDGKSSQSETRKGVEAFHIHHFAKSWSGSKAQSTRQSTETDKAISDAICSTNTQLTSYNSSLIVDYPLFLKNRVFRL